MGDSHGRQPTETATADSQGRQPRETTKGDSHGNQPWKTATGDSHESQLQESVKEASHLSQPQSLRAISKNGLRDAKDSEAGRRSIPGSADSHHQCSPYAFPNPPSSAQTASLSRIRPNLYCRTFAATAHIPDDATDAYQQIQYFQVASHGRVHSVTPLFLMEILNSFLDPVPLLHERILRCMRSDGRASGSSALRHPGDNFVEIKAVDSIGLRDWTHENWHKSLTDRKISRTIELPYATLHANFGEDDVYASKEESVVSLLKLTSTQETRVPSVGDIGNGPNRSRNKVKIVPFEGVPSPEVAVDPAKNANLARSIWEADPGGIFSLPAVTPLASSIPGVQSPNPKALFQRSNLFYPQSPFTVSILKSRVSIVAISATSNGLLLLRRMATTGRRSDPCVRSAGLLRIQFNPAGIFLRGGETIVDREATVGRPRSANHAFNSSSRSPPPHMLSICLSDYPPSSLPNCFTLPYTPDLGYCRPSAATAQLPDDAHDAYQQSQYFQVASHGRHTRSPLSLS
nr:hypothetical protein Iba_chr12bCG17340 [Ipomoea batatas]